MVQPQSQSSDSRKYRQLLTYAVRHWRGWLLIVVVTLLSTAFSLLQPWPMKLLVDNVLGSRAMSVEVRELLALLPGTGSPEGLLLWVVVGGLVIFALNSTADVVLTFAWVRTGQRMVYDLAEDMFARLQRRSLLFHTHNAVGDSISRVTTDAWGIHTVVDTLLFAPLHAAITMVAMVVVMVQLDAGLTLLSLAVAPLMVLSSRFFGKSVRKAAKAKREIESRIQSHVQQILTGIPVVQAFAQEDREFYRFNSFAADAIQAHRRTALADRSYSLLSGLITTLGTGAILLVGAYRIFDGHFTVGSLLVFLSYLGSLQTQMKTLSRIPIALQGVAPSIDRVMEILETPVEVSDRKDAQPLDQVQGHVRFHNVSFGYDDGQQVLHDLSLEALPGQTIAVVGATGAGKSTLLSLLPRFYDPWQGSISIDGVDLRDVQISSLRQKIAVVLQEPFLFPLTIAENIAYGRQDATAEQIEAAARAANAHSFIERLPDGYQTVLGERGGTLSGGERQRLSIARALLKDAPILILDEPTSALDAQTEGMLLEALERLMAGRTTFIIAHRLSTIRNADTIIVLRDGRIVEAGTHRQLLDAEGYYSHLHHYQFGAAMSEVTA